MLDTEKASIPSRMDFAHFPLKLGSWVGVEAVLEEEVEKVLAADDYLLVDFEQADGDTVNFYAAYYTSQLEGRSVHSPRICIPGGGWTITDFSTVDHSLDDGTSFPLNRAELELNSERQLVYYWFEQRGRRLANEYWLKWYLMSDSITMNRTDGALIRVTTVVHRGEDITLADARIKAFISDVISVVPDYVPAGVGSKFKKDII